MKKQLFSLFLTAVLMSCASASAEQDISSSEPQDQLPGVTSGNEMDRTNANATSVSDIEGNEWKLIAVYIDGRNTRFSRNTLPEELRNFFTLNFAAEHISGVGAPNRYSAPYAKGENRAISIMLIRSTLMASFFQPENLDEHDFFVYLQNVYEWRLVNETLELYSKTENGGEIRLVFSL